MVKKHVLKYLQHTIVGLEKLFRGSHCDKLFECIGVKFFNSSEGFFQRYVH